MIETRPLLRTGMAETELRRWYWLREELAAFARVLGLSTAGGKAELLERIAAHLSGRPRVDPTPRARGAQLGGEVTSRTVIPEGQRASQTLREFFRREIGDAFHFDGPMRDFIRDGAGRTLGDAVAHWYATRDRGPQPIGEQFELNRFSRAWRERNPNGPREALLEEWRAYRAQPVEARGRA